MKPQMRKPARSVRDVAPPKAPPAAVPAPAKQPDAIAVPPEPAGHSVRMAKDAALGFGTRPRGTVLAQIICAPGVELAEVLTALANAHLIDVSA